MILYFDFVNIIYKKKRSLYRALKSIRQGGQKEIHFYDLESRKIPGACSESARGLQTVQG